MKKTLIRVISIFGILVCSLIGFIYLAGKSETVNQFLISSLFGHGKENNPMNHSVLLATGLQAKDIIKRAESGDSVMQHNLATMYQVGEGVEKNQEKSSYWFLKAAMQGLPQSQTKVGARYWQGAGIPMDREKAVYWMKKAAEQGEVTAEVALSNAYTIGFGNERPNYEKAFFWMLKAAQRGEPQAQFKVAEMYANGRGIGNDGKQALYWYRLAARNNSRSAMQMLSEIYALGLLGESKNESESEKWMKLAAGLKP